MGLMSVLEEVSKEKKIDSQSLVRSVCQAVSHAYKKKFGAESDIRVEINSETEQLQIFAKKRVVSKVADKALEIDLKSARKIAPTIAEGESLEIVVDAAEFGRIAVKAIKQIVSQNLAEEERESEFNEIIRKEKDIVVGRVQRIEHKKQGTVFLEIGKIEVALPHKNQIPGETFAIGDSVKVFVSEVLRRDHSVSVTITRSSPEFLKRLFEREIPEVREGIVKVKAVSREAGSRAKVAIYSDDSSIDPVGACVGIRGGRLGGITEELNGEKLDIVKYTPNLKEFISNALAPAKVGQINLNADRTVAEVIVPHSQISLAIGSGGQNVRLAARLVNCNLDLKSEK